MDAMSASAAYADDQARWDAVRRRDGAADGRFFYSVRSTGVYCRPSCSSRPKRRENVAFHGSAAEAERAGFRPCKRCRPDRPPRAEREAALVAEACRTLDAAEDEPRLAALAAQAGVSPYHFHRLFRRIAGVTPRAYAAQRRQRRAQDTLAAGSAVTEAIYDAGFNSSSRFYAAAPAMLGMTPTAYRKGGAGETLWCATARCALGRVLVAATARGIAAILLGDDDKSLRAELRERFAKARIETPHAGFAETLAAVVRLVDDPGRGVTLPLDIRGTAFQRRVWEELQKVPAGETVSYGRLAARAGRPDAVRAVAGACAANRHAVAIPCHRAVAADGGLAGYRWGIARKRRLLERERG